MNEFCEWIDVKSKKVLRWDVEKADFEAENVPLKI